MRTLIMAAGALALFRQEPPPDLLKVFREEFVSIAAGTFTMGSDLETPAHKVSISTAFRIAKVEVPQNLWEAVMGQNPSKWKGKRNSVEMLSFDQAVEFCEKATRQMRQAKLIE